MKIKNIVFCIIFLLLVAGCAHLNYVKDTQRIVKNADWSKMETVSISLKEFSFTPSTLIFRKNTPYKLEVRNEGKTKHYFTSEDFFKAIATRKVQSNTDGEVKADYLTAIEVYPGRSLDVYFVPMIKGRYPLRCQIEGHAERGMVGYIDIR